MVEQSIVHIAIGISAACNVLLFIYGKDIVEMIRDWKNNKKNNK